MITAPATRIKGVTLTARHTDARRLRDCPRFVPRPRETHCHHHTCLPRPRNMHFRARVTRFAPRPRKTYCHHHTCLPRPRNLHVHVRRRRRVWWGAVVVGIATYAAALRPGVSPVQGKHTVTTTLVCHDQGIFTSGGPGVTVTMWL